MPDASLVEPVALTPAEVRTLLALVHVWRRDGRATVRTVAAARHRGAASTHHHIRRLIDAGFAASEHKGALRPLVR